MKTSNYRTSTSLKYKVTLLCLTFLFVVTLLTSCNKIREWNESRTNSTPSASYGMQKDESNNVPEYAGTWISSEDSYSVIITKVNDKLYDVKYTNLTTLETNHKISGAYNLSSDYKSIARSVPVDYNSTTASNDIGMEYRINFSDDGRLYWGGTFYSRKLDQ